MLSYELKNRIMEYLFDLEDQLNIYHLSKKTRI